MIRSNINSTRNYGVVLKLERFSHISGRSFWLGFLIGFEWLSLVLLLRVDISEKGYLETGYPVS